MRGIMLDDCYRSHGGIHRVAIVWCPEICGERLVHLSQDSSRSWALRDFLTHKMIRNSPCHPIQSSNLRLADIENTVEYCEPPPFHNIDYVQDWTLYLRLRTMVVFSVREGRLDYSRPNPVFGTWGLLA